MRKVKKLFELTDEEKGDICDNHSCDNCPLALYDEDKDEVCVKHINKEMLEELKKMAEVGFPVGEALDDEEKLEALRIIYRKNVVIDYIKHAEDVYDYNSLIHNEDDKLTDKEFDLVQGAEF